MIDRLARKVLFVGGSLSDAVFGPALIASAHKFAGEVRLPVYFVQQLLLIEDKRFAYHPGIDLLSVIRALVFNVGTSPSRWHGASTITQQIYSGAARLKGHYRPTVRFKVAQTTWAIVSTLKSSKIELLNLYLDSVDRAARGFCGKVRRDLTIAESFFLVERIARPNKVSVARVDMLARRTPIAALFSEDVGAIDQLAALYDRHFGCGKEIAKCLERSLKKRVAPMSTYSVAASNEQ